MKNKIITSALTIICVLCGGWVSDAFAAPSVRALGGAGTYSGTTSAAAAKSGGAATTSARAGSVRVTPTAKVSASTTPRISNVETKVSSSGDQRMSIGKYLGPSVTGGVNISTGGSGASAEDITELAGQIDQNAKDIKANTDALEKLDEQINGGKETVGIIDQLEDFLTKDDAKLLYQEKEDVSDPYIVQSEISSTNETFKNAVAGVVSALGGDVASIKSWVTTEYGTAPSADGMYVLNRTAAGAQWKKVDDYATDFDKQGISFED